ncbi:hypothetical protein KMZ30_07210 [Phycicoccus sp. KQZ13P-1]|uniref:hypothetical protein n=1 Tax=Phycicoccus mangrovi TaxID=2840470 RepID=UPI001C001E16|nr:hypothetical protein [Phycicoccus mangrovi]MBT9255359.1 hypothetical protein [Phycicoccus mangrovi]
MSRTARLLAPLAVVGVLFAAAAPSAQAYPLPGGTPCYKTIIYKGRVVYVPQPCPLPVAPRIDATKHRAVVVDHGGLAR